jgi:hypothetical protein
MANPVAFQGQNVVYTHPDCFDLPVCRQTTMLGNEPTIEVISAWQFTEAEKEEFGRTGTVYLRIIGGQPPVSVGAFNYVSKVEGQPSDFDTEFVKEVEAKTARNMDLIGAFLDHVKEETGVEVPESALLSFFNA